MRFKAVAVFLMAGMALFTAFYWLTDGARRESEFQAQQAELIEFGTLYFGPDEIIHTVTVSAAGFEPAVIEIEINASINFTNALGSDITLRGTGSHPFEAEVKAGKVAKSRFGSDGVTLVTADGVAGSLEVTAGPEFLSPLGANCARCHGADGTGGVTPQGNQAPNLHSRALANKWKATGGEVANIEDGAPPILNNYVNWAIRYGGIVVSGNAKSEMPAWGAEGGLTLHQIDALTALIGTWANEALQQPVEGVPDTVEAGKQVYVEIGCVNCHGADYSGVAGTFPSLLNIGNEPVIDLPTPISGLDKLQADYDADARAFLEMWIRDSATNYNDGAATGMFPYPEGTLSADALQALITFLLSLKQ